MIRYDDGPDETPDDDPRAWVHIAPVYDPPRMSYGGEPGAGLGCLITLAILAVVFGLGTTWPGYEWLIDGALAFGICSLTVLIPAWWRALHR